MIAELFEDIKFSLERYSSKNTFDNTLNLLNVMGYYSQRMNRIIPNSPANFVDTFDVYRDMNKERAKFNLWDKVDFIFQYSSSEIEPYASNFEITKVDNTIIQSYLFLALELKGFNYTKDDFRQISYEFNRFFLKPCFIIFKYSDELALSIMDRRINKIDEYRDVIQNLHVIRGISIQNPQEEYVKMIYELSLPIILKNFAVTNFVELHNIWKNILNKTNKHFIFNVQEYIEIGSLFMEQEEYNNAIIYLDAALDFEPENEEALQNRAVCFFEIKEYAYALEDCHTILSLNPYNNIALNIMGMLENYNKDEYRD